MEKIKIGIIGGTGLYDIEGFTNKKEIDVDTPFGKPSDSIIVGEFAGKKMAFLPRHGKGHRILPSEVNQLANIWALKSLGVEILIGVTAVGSLKAEIAPTHIVIPDQIIDKTKDRPKTFFGNGLVVHVPLAEPFCNDLRELIHKAAHKVDCTTHFGGTYVCMEGPQFSTKAESNLHRSWGASVIGMTAIPESKLAREAEMCYASISLATDYDCWHEEEDAVTSDAVMKIVQQNSETAKNILKNLIPMIDTDNHECGCNSVLSYSIVTERKLVPDETYENLKIIIEKYM